MAESNVIGGNQLAESQISSQSGSLAGTTAGSVSYKETNLGGVKTFIAIK